MVSFTMPSDYQSEAADIERRRAYAQALQAQGMEPLQAPPTPPGGYAVPVSPLAGLAKALQAGLGAYKQREANDEQKALAARLRGDTQNTLQQARNAFSGTPAIDNVNQSNQGLDSFDPRPAQAPNPAAGFDILAASQNPALAQIGLTGMMDQYKPKPPVVVGRSLVDPKTNKVVATDETWAQEQAAERARREAEAAEKRAEAQRREQSEQAFRAQLERDRAADRENALRVAASLRPAPQPREPRQAQVIQTPDGPMILGADGSANPIPGPGGKPIAGKSTEKALPTSAAQKLMDNQQNLRRAEEALALIEGKNVGDALGDKGATGWKGYLPDAVLQRVDPEGVATRAKIGDLGSLVIHDRSGAAVTAAEYPRLRPFIPDVKDDPETVKKKLGSFVREYRNIVGEAVDFYKESGYKVPEGALRGGGYQGPERRAPSAAPQGFKVLGVE